MGLDFLWVGETRSFSIPTGVVRLDDYQRLDFVAELRPTDRLRITGAIDNLTSTDYEEAPGFPSPDVRPRIAATWAF